MTTRKATPKPVRILLVDSNTLFSEGLRLLLDAGGPLRVVDHIAANHVSPARLRRQDWDLLVIDPEGYETELPVMKKAAGARPVVAVSDHAHPVIAVELMLSGADVFAWKRAKPADLLESLAAAAEGIRPAGASRRAEAPPRPPLNERETDVLRGIAEGRPARMKGGALRRCRASLQDKLGLREDADLAEYAVAAGLCRLS
jgi:DNA-binding NarL/FixJ family response regulator